jgi:hypothetical protein
MIRIIAATLAASFLLTMQQAQASDSCRPTRDGKDRVSPANGCPSGYVMRGACCESINTMSQSGTAVKTCPAGTVSSLGVCVAKK